MKSILVLFLLLLACGPDSSSVKDPPLNPQPDASIDPIPVDPIPGELSIIRTTSWPGGGRELTLRIHVDPKDAPDLDLSKADYSERFKISVDGVNAQSLTSHVQKVALTPGYTAILIKPAATAPERMLQSAELKSFVEARPDSESIAFFIWLETVEQLAAFTHDRERLLVNLKDMIDMPPAATPLPAAEAIAIAQKEAMGIGGKAPRGMRALVLAGDDSDTPQTGLPTFSNLSTASEDIDFVAAHAFYTIGLCTPTIAIAGSVQVKGIESTSLGFGAPPTLPEEQSEQQVTACDPTTIGPGQRVFPKTIELHFTDEQKSIYDQKVNSLNKEDFELSVSLGQGAPPIAAVAHMRGHASLRCERKGYTIRLEGPKRHIIPNSRVDEFYLISMCEDDHYIHQYTANQLMSELGFFPLQFGLVEVYLNGETKGVYLLLEKSREELIRDNSRVRSVIRRRSSPPADFLLTLWEAEREYDSDDFYDAALDDLESTNSRVSLKKYLQFIALMTSYRNGDYVDEFLLTSTDQYNTDGSIGDWFQFMGWDNDDIFSDCHRDGDNAFSDRNGLVFCAEARLDKALLGNSTYYAQYVDILEDLLLNLVTPDRFDIAVEKTATDLLPFFNNEATCTSMVRLVRTNPGATDPVEAKRDLREHLDEMKMLYRQRHALLLERIQSYRE